LRKLNLYITKEKRNTLLGREWLIILRKDRNIKNFLNNKKIKSIKVAETLDQNQLNALLHKYQSITVPTASKILHVQSKLTPKENTKLIFYKVCPVPFPLRTLVEEELH